MKLKDFLTNIFLTIIMNRKNVKNDFILQFILKKKKNLQFGFLLPWPSKSKINTLKYFLELRICLCQIELLSPAPSKGYPILRCCMWICIVV